VPVQNVMAITPPPMAVCAPETPAAGSKTSAMFGRQKPRHLPLKLTRRGFVGPQKFPAVFLALGNADPPE
jgi:hypothetical protein